MISIILLMLGIVLGGIIGSVLTARLFFKRIHQAESISSKNEMLYHMTNEWLRKKQEGKFLSSLLLKYGYKKIAIYGMAYMGERLVDELRDSEIEVEYAIDRNAVDIYSTIDVLKPSDDLSEVDVVIVTSIAFFDEVKEQLSKKLHCPIVALDDVIYAL